MLAILLVCVSTAAVSLKLRQDFAREAAFTDLSQLGVRNRVVSLETGGIGLELKCTAQLTDADVDRLLADLDALERRHDLGLSAGLRMLLVDLSGCGVSAAAVAKLRTALPQAEILP